MSRRPRAAIVITRDRTVYAGRCVTALEDVGLDVHIVDHGSTYGPMLALLEFWEAVGFSVHRRGTCHPRSLWKWPGLGRIVRDAPFIVTDCDVVPDENCPADWPDVLGELLEQYPHRAKVGLGLRVDDLPQHYEHASRVRDWEEKYWRHCVGLTKRNAGVYAASVDTTLAAYRSVQPFTIDPSLRVVYPYLARHLTWYENSAKLLDDVRWYRDHLPTGVSHWVSPDSFERGGR